MQQASFPASTSWTMSHPWGTVHPSPVVTDTGGHTWLVAPDYGDGTVTVTFSQPLAGTLTLIGPNEFGDVVLPPPTRAAATPPFDNAALIEVRAPGALDKYGKQTVLGTVLWVGRAPGYLKRPRRSTVTGGDERTVKGDELILRAVLGVPTRIAPGAAWDGATVTVDDFRDGNGVRRRFRVQAADLRGVGSLVDSLRLDLVNEQET